MSRELGEDAAAETEVELRPPLQTGRLPKPGHDRLMSGRSSPGFRIPCGKKGTWCGRFYVYDRSE